jgi:hypothetical protein
MSKPAKVETARRPCPEHGMVQAVREVPPPSFPFVVYLVRLIKARRAPFTCPECHRELMDDKVRHDKAA